MGTHRDSEYIDERICAKLLFFLVPKLCDDAQNYHHHPCLQNCSGNASTQVIFKKTSRVQAHHLHLVDLTPRKKILLERTVSTPRAHRTILHQNARGCDHVDFENLTHEIQAKRVKKLAHLEEKLHNMDIDQTVTRDSARKEEMFDIQRELNFVNSKIQDLQSRQETCPCAWSKMHS